MRTLALCALALLVATPALASDAAKPAGTQQIQVPPPAIQSDAIKPLTQPSVVFPPPKPVVPAAVPKARLSSHRPLEALLAARAAA